MIEHTPELLEAGISSLKIEGRMKSAYYTGVITNAYRHAMDAALFGKSVDTVWIKETERCSHRPYTTGFYYGQPGQHYEEASYFATADIAAVVQSCDEKGNALLTQRNKIQTGDLLELLLPDRVPIRFSAGELYSEEGELIADTRRAMMPFRMTLPAAASPLSIVRKLRESP
jgi:putative protease